MHTLPAQESIAKLEADTEYETPLTISKRIIPIRYTFLNPATLEVIGGELAQFVGKQVLAVRISLKLARLVNTPTPETQPLIDMLPKDMVTHIKDGHRVITLDSEKLAVAHYKKDDWAEWADPVHYSILDDIKLYNKMKLADLSALDGAISQVRLWKLGDLDKGLFPTDVAVNKLSEILLSNPGGGAFDLIWGPELTLEESRTTVHQFLGESKYKPVMAAIYEGMGVPPTLTGSGDAGMTNNYVALQTLIKRLEYGRMMVRAFWSQEVELVRQAMGYQKGAKVVFDNDVLTDEQSMKSLLIQLADRDVISVSTLLERFQEDPEIERLRIKKENEWRDKGVLSPKASAWHDPEKLHRYILASIPRGYMDPRHAGVEFCGIDEEQMELELQTPFEIQVEQGNVPSRNDAGPDQSYKKVAPKPNTGRPKGVKDSQPRNRTEKPRTGRTAVSHVPEFVTLAMWAKHAQQQIAEIVTPGILERFDKTSQRQLSAGEVAQAERTKFAILAQIKPFTHVTADLIQGIAEDGVTLDKPHRELYDGLVQELATRYRRQPTIAEVRMLQATTYAVMNAS